MAFPRLPLTPAILAGLVLAAPSLSAADFQFGLQAGLGIPGNDLKSALDSSSGGGLGGFMLIKFRNGHTLRPRLDIWSYRGSDLEVPGVVTITREASLTSIGADYLYYTGGNPERGFYLVAGAGISSNSVEATASAFGATAAVKHRVTKVYDNLGLGYQFNPHWGAEARLTVSTWTTPDGNRDLTLSQVTANVSYRF